LRGEALYNLKRDDEALAAFKTVLRSEPKALTSLVAIGELHFRAGRFDQAKVAFTDVLRLYPSNARAHLQLGRIAYRNGDDAAARAAWQKAAAYGGQTPDGREAVERLFQLGRSAQPAR
jgi:Flp pilus assembly protein TadD